MKLLSNKIVIVAIALTVPASAGLAVVSSLTASATNNDSPFCTNLPNRVSQINSQLSNLQTKLTTAWSQRDQQITANDTKWDQALTAERAEWATNRQGQFTKLQAKATTDAQKAAVQAYITALTNAISTRESANDTARTTFRTAVHNLIANNRAAINAQVTAFVNATAAAESAAQASCQATPNQGPAIRTTFVAAMKSARQTFVNDRKADAGIGDQVKQLAQTRNITIKANDAAFQSAAKAAADTLKAAFKNASI